MTAYAIPAKPIRSPQSHKGQYGKVLVVGGSPDYYGAPILTALGAEYSGADLITLCLPEAHNSIAKNYSLNFFIKNFKNELLTDKDVDDILLYSQNYHVLAIGNGLGKHLKTQTAVLKILTKLTIPVIIDAEALFPEILNINAHKRDWILTPHSKEFERVFQIETSVQNIKAQAKEHDLTILVKGPVDYIATKNDFYENHTGCAQMRVGGTGDVLAGIIANYRAQNFSSFQAACAGAYHYGKAGEKLAEKQDCFSARSLAKFFAKKL